MRKDYEDSTDDEDYDIAVAGVMKVLFSTTKEANRQAMLNMTKQPDITFFGEDLPKTFHDRLVEHDRNLVDLVLIIGTSLKVAPVSEIPSFLPSGIPQLYISREVSFASLSSKNSVSILSALQANRNYQTPQPCSHVDFDVNLLGDCDVVVTELCRRVGWDLQHEMIPKAQKVDVQLRDVQTCRYSFKVEPT